MASRLTLVLAALALGLAACSSAAAAGGPLVAPSSVCPGQTRAGAATAAQEQTMLCMTNYARAGSGLSELTATAALEESARDKAGDILLCDSFSHYACGREFTYWMRETGYLSSECWKAGENLAWGTGEYGTVGSIFRAWMRSPEHRANILGDYTQVGIDLQLGELEGRAGTHVWAQHFGSHCEAPPA
jgi:uncharacterized protein YkwD